MVKPSKTRRAVADGEQRKRAARFRKVFGTADGKQVLEDLIAKSGMNGPLFATDQLVQDANVARNDFMVWVIEQINWKPVEGKEDTSE
jgi:hypothetical protein